MVSARPLSHEHFTSNALQVAGEWARLNFEPNVSEKFAPTVTVTVKIESGILAPNQPRRRGFCRLIDRYAGFRNSATRLTSSASDTATSNRSANSFFIAVRGSGIDEPVAHAQRI